MNVLIDANILIAVFNKEYPLFPFAARILSLHGHRQFRISITPISLAIAFYFSEKKSGRNVAMRKIELATRNMDVAENLKSHPGKYFKTQKSMILRTACNIMLLWKIDAPA